MNPREEKQRIREHVWRLLMREGVARPPFPIWGRIPNFEGAEVAASLLLRLEPFRHARVVKVNPDSPQRPVRELCLRKGKTLIMPTPRIREGFLILNPMELDEPLMRQASTIRGAFELGDKVEPESLDRVDLIVAGSVAVSRRGERVGKGEGYSEIEYAILRMFGKVLDDTPIITTVHTLQNVERIPVEEFDVPIDIIATEKEIFFTETKIPRPKGITWELLGERKIKEIPLLQRLRKT
ncbi:MAG: 5-formyltetrahydrofolate cyclo-ligase [Nitrososphaerota archaeon]|nr:5-formyltetrahydrofolate cyclo-ligase [Candidatus Calditenuaceae archaeon]MDW8073078.1 5-formyltetrahydrofolate cyclo-ligase [Nitrososphaerota archaeon]